VPPSSEIIAAMKRQSMPLEVLQLHEPELATGHGLLLVRPDQHIAWRGCSCEDSRVADNVVARVLGWDPHRSHAR
jgi:hypothetical protein